MTIRLNGETEQLGVGTIAELVAAKSDMPAGRRFCGRAQRHAGAPRDWATTAAEERRCG